MVSRDEKLNRSLSDGSNGELPAMAISLIDFANICDAVDYFFRSGEVVSRKLV